MQNLKFTVKEFEFEFLCKEPSGGAIISPDKLYDVIKTDYSPIQEKMTLLVLNTANKVIYSQVIASGMMNSIMCSPDVIYRTILQCKGNNFILAHNHPSGRIEPSEEDIQVTKKIIKGSKLIGLNLLDHIVYSDTEYYSFRANGLI